MRVYHVIGGCGKRVPLINLSVADLCEMRRFADDPKCQDKTGQSLNAVKDQIDILISLKTRGALP